MIITQGGYTPIIASSAFVAPDAWVIGDVELGENVSVYFGSVLRGDILPIRIGKNTNIQEQTIIHTSRRKTPSIIGENTTVGHRALIHSPCIGSRVLIGMGAIILDEAEIGDECIIGAGALVTQGKKFPPRSLVVGSPGRVVRQVRDDEIDYLLESAENYVARGQEYKQLLSS